MLQVILFLVFLTLLVYVAFSMDLLPNFVKDLLPPSFRKDCECSCDFSEDPSDHDA